MSGGTKKTVTASPAGDTVIAPAFLVLRNLSYRRRISRAWVSPSGARVTSGDGTVDVPYGGLDRLSLCLLATRARSAGRTFHGRPHDLRVMFGLSSVSDDAIAESLARVAFSMLQLPRSTHECPCRWCRRQPLAERTTVADVFGYCGESGQFSCKLSRAFADEARAGIAVSAAVLGRFAESRPQPSLIDLYVWLMQRADAGDVAPIPVFGEASVCSLLTIANGDAHARGMFAKRLALVHQAWPACPYGLSTDSRTLVYVGPASEDVPDEAKPAAVPSDAANESRDATIPAWLVGLMPDIAAREAQPEAQADAESAAPESAESTAPEATSTEPESAAPESASTEPESVAPKPRPTAPAPGDGLRMPRDPYIAQALALAMMQLEQSVSAWQTVVSANTRAPPRTAQSPETASGPTAPTADSDRKLCSSE